MSSTDITVYAVNNPPRSKEKDPHLSDKESPLTVALFGNSTSVQFGHDNTLLGEESHPLKEFSRIDPVQMKISEHNVSVINMLDFTERQLDSVDHLIGQLVHENEICAFIFVVRLGQLTDADKMGLEWLQTVFGDRILQFVIILFTYEREEECDTIIDDLKKNSVMEQLLNKCGGRYHTCSKTMNNRSEMRDLMKEIDRLFNENKDQCYTVEMYNTQLNRHSNLQKNENDSDKPTIKKKSMEHTPSRELQYIHKGIVGYYSSTHIRLEQHHKKEINEKVKQLFDQLHLKSHNNLRASDVLQITSHSLQSNESCAEEDLVKNYLQTLLMMNYRARHITTKETSEHYHTLETDNASDDDEGDLFDIMSSSNAVTSKSDSIHPMDVQMAVFHCADIFLKQLMVTKLSQCQFALPLLVPHPFTQHIEFPLWTFRQINKSWKIRRPDNDIISRVQSVCKAETPMVSFFRFGSVSSSKSQLMNSLINEKHNTFFTRNCPGSSRTRLLMDGVVEIAWYCPSEKNTDKFTDCVAFCNLHGDAGDNETQMKILTEMSSVNVVLLTKLDKNDKNASKIQELLKNSKPLIFLFTAEESAVSKVKNRKYKIGLKDRNQSDVSEELRRAINDCLPSSGSASVFRLEDVSKHSNIRVDEEDNEDCRRGREAAQQMMSLLKNKPLKEIKESFLPHQGELWHLWCQKNKELHRPQGKDIEQEISRKQTEMKKIREKQHESDTSECIKLFIKQMTSHDVKKMFFLRWLRILLDEFTSADLSVLYQKYNKKWSTVLKLKENAKLKSEEEEQLKAEQTQLELISSDLQATAFGLEHIMREISQIYESCLYVKKNKTDLEFDFSSLPSLAADMMISGFPLELMDGDAAHVPVMWVTAVLDKLIQKLGDQRVFVLSILGIQSSGKSTMLNAMFGLEFAVSAGRCTRGAFMQLIRVSEDMKHQMKFDYILVVDTEGLRASELAGRSTRHHDNELATFVVGLGYLTLINIFGENPSEMQEILQIVVQAFLRMKKVKLNPSCIFVHQNVSDITAGERNMEGRRRLLDTLDQMTELAAKEEVYDAECFSDVIKFDVQNDVEYFAQLWEGSPPMAPPNPNYCENVEKLRKAIVSHASNSTGMRLTHLCQRIQDLWEASLNERFVFSFRNSLEISAYRRLETEYSKWTWTLRSAIMKIQTKLHNQIDNEVINEIVETDLQKELEEKSDEVTKSMSEFFDKDTDSDILIQWKTSFEIKLSELQENIVKETTWKLNEILQQRDLKRKLDAQGTHHENTLLEKSKELALQHKDKTNDEETLKREFGVFWEECVKKITTDSPPIKDIDILKDVRELLSDIYESVNVDTWNDIRNIFTVPNYSDYVQLKRSSGVTGHLKNVIKAAKEKIGLKLSKEDETQIRTFITDVSYHTDEMIQSYNISKLGYNISYIQQLTDYIKARITEYEKGPVKYVFKREFFIDLLFSIFKRVNKTLTDQHKKFRDANDPDLYLEKKKREYYSIFQKYCQGATSAAIFGEIICQKLKEPIEQSVYRQTARDLADEMRSNCPSLNGNRSNLEKHILKRLAEEENFDKYINYIHNPRDHFKSFIRDEVSQYIRDQFSVSVQLKMNQNIELLQKKIMTAAHKSTQHVQENRGNVDVWLKFFTQKLSDVLMFSVKDFSGVKHDDVDDYKLLEDVIRKELPSITSDITREFSTDSFDVKLDLNYRTDEIVIDHLCQCCWVQCPFCKAICTNTIENHDGDHSVPFHRVDGINGWFYTKSNHLCVNFCTTVVTAEHASFKVETSDQWFYHKEYRKAGGVYAEWSITPDLSELPYWKWFMCRFQDDLEKYYERTFRCETTEEWRIYTKKDAIESLDTYFK
ncbi:interferon-induced very large GTPase 1-like [Triplophysa dalaica]|uniref:interferon-induced very large GTPase 1-like n=1 Tax=Triplophysa dalaica TaxID=1582913 RepID=UPI0024DFD27D|nr:interferon-induced very large GTPase 1-like [Triplophysa dalaica]